MRLAASCFQSGLALLSSLGFTGRSDGYQQGLKNGPQSLLQISWGLVGRAAPRPAPPGQELETSEFLLEKGWAGRGPQPITSPSSG